MSRSADVIVVGAGPAGCAAAYDLATAGCDVLLVDRRDFPRVKPCAGALTAKTLRALRFSVAPVVRQVTTNFTTTWSHARRSRFVSRHPLAALTVRSELDHFLLERTRTAGARFQRIAPLLDITVGAHDVRLRTSNDTLCGRYLVGADGADSSVRRLTGEFPDARWGLAIEAQVAGPAVSKDLEFDFGIVPQGYGWVFPKGDHFNVGIYSSDSRVALRPALVRAYARDRLGKDCVHVVGQRVGIGAWSYRPRHPRVLLVGDAAGLAEPLLGEGIYYAVTSGQAAAEAIVSELHGRASARAIFRERIAALSRDVRCAHQLAKRFHADHNAGYEILTARVVSYFATKGTSVGLTIREVLRTFYTLPFRDVPSLPGLSTDASD